MFKNKALNRIKRPSFSRVSKDLIMIFQFLLLTGISFVILYPFIIKISAAFMSVEDTYDSMVLLIPRKPTFENIKYLFSELPMLKAFLNTLVISTLVALSTTITSVLVGYGLAKFRFYGKGIIIFIVLFSLLIPLSTVMIPSYMYFRYFDVFGLFNLLFGETISTVNTGFPLVFLSATGFGFRSGLFILILFQAFKGLPKELDEASMVDGSTIAQTFLLINLPLVKSMALVAFIISFAWQWTDSNYIDLFYSDSEFFPKILVQISSVSETVLGNGTYVKSLITNGALLLMVTPLIIFYVFVQKQLVAGIERTGLVG